MSLISGVYKNEVVALKDIVADYIERKIKAYDEINRNMQNKYHRDFQTFTQYLKNKATMKLEEDWMEWKGAVEMKAVWKKALKNISPPFS